MARREPGEAVAVPGKAVVGDGRHRGVDPCRILLRLGAERWARVEGSCLGATTDGRGSQARWALLNGGLGVARGDGGRRQTRRAHVL